MNQRQLEHAIHQARRALDELERTAPTAIDRDHRGGTNERDGYPTTSINDGGHQPFTVDSTSTTTAAALDRIDHGTDRRDDVRTAARALAAHLDLALKQLHRAVARTRQIHELANPDGRHTNPPTACNACHRTVMCTTADPISSGYCGECADSWYRWRKKELDAGRTPDRVRFEHWRRRQVA